MARAMASDRFRPSASARRSSASHNSTGISDETTTLPFDDGIAGTSTPILHRQIQAIHRNLENSGVFLLTPIGNCESSSGDGDTSGGRATALATPSQPLTRRTVVKRIIVKIEIFPDVNEAGERVWRVEPHYRLPSGRTERVPDTRGVATNADALAEAERLVKPGD